MGIDKSRVIYTEKYIRDNLWLFQPAKMLPDKLIGNRNTHNSNEKEVLS